MPRGRPQIYRHSSGQARTRIAGRMYYLGPYGSSEARQRYHSLLGEWISAGSPVPWIPAAQRQDAPPSGSVLVGDVAHAYEQHAATFYARSPSELDKVVRSMAMLRACAAELPVSKFGPRALADVQHQLIGLSVVPLARTTVNAYVARIRRAFRWAASVEMIPPEVYHGLTAVPGLQAGRSTATEPEEVQPVPDEHVEAVAEVVPPAVAAMIRVQLLTGMRPGEVVTMRGRDLTMRGDVWTYRPARHKTQRLGKARTIYLGPRAQELVREWLRDDLEAPLFPSRLRRAYTERGYCQAITRACDRGDARLADGSTVPRWTPNQLRHNAGTRFREARGLEVSRVLLGHSKVETTQVYAERDADAARRAIIDLG